MTKINGFYVGPSFQPLKETLLSIKENIWHRNWSHPPEFPKTIIKSCQMESPSTWDFSYSIQNVDRISRDRQSSCSQGSTLPVKLITENNYIVRNCSGECFRKLRKRIIIIMINDCYEDKSEIWNGKSLSYKICFLSMVEAFCNMEFNKYMCFGLPFSFLSFYLE